MTDLFSDAAGVADLDALASIARREQVGAKRTSIAIAHGLAYDPHVDGKLRLTPVGRDKLAAYRGSA